MSPELIEQLHRIEHKVDRILEILRLGESNCNDINETNICPICFNPIKWKYNINGETTRDCNCDLKFKTILKIESVK